MSDQGSCLPRAESERPILSTPYIRAGVPEALAIWWALTPARLKAWKRLVVLTKLRILARKVRVDLRLPPTEQVPSSFARRAVLTLRMRAAAVANTGRLAYTIDFLAGSCSSKSCSRTLVTKLTTCAMSLTTKPGAPVVESMRSTTYNLELGTGCHLRCSSIIISSSKSRGSEVANPEPAVMPQVALMHRECTPSIPTVRCKW